MPQLGSALSALVRTSLSPRQSLRRAAPRVWLPANTRRTPADRYAGPGEFCICAVWPSQPAFGMAGAGAAAAGTGAPAKGLQYTDTDGTVMEWDAQMR